jgi:RNA polymerase sigma factor (sigma-70 family)
MTDAEIVKQVLNGNQNAGRFLVLNYQKLVFHIVRRILNNDAGIEDICQDVFLKVFRQLHHFRGDSKLSTWIATIAYNTSISHLKKIKDSRELRIDASGLANLKGTGSSHQESKLEMEEIKEILLKTIDTIPLHYRTLLTLFYLEEFSYQEIEKITGMPEGTIKNYLFRARYLLKCKLEKMQHYEKSPIFAV